MPTLPTGYLSAPRPFWGKGEPTNVQLFHGRAEFVLPLLPDNSVDMVFADPPYNIGYKYDNYNDELPVKKYMALARCFLRNCARVVRPGGAVWVMCHSTYFAHFELAIADVGLYTINRVIWRYTFGQNQRDRFTPSWVPLFYAVKPPLDLRVFNVDDIRVQSARQRLKDKRANPDGKVPDDVWDDIPRLVGNAKERVGHPCQLPLEVVRRAVLACTDPGDTVLDPFLGSGTTAVVCIETGRKCLGVELSANYLTDFVIPRLQQA